MKQLRRFFLWYALLTKRLLRRSAYFALLLAVPLLTGGMSLTARDGAGLLTVALAGGEADAAAQEARERLLAHRSTLRYLEYDTPEQAIDAVRNAQADAAWIFRPDAAAQVGRFAASAATQGAVLVVEREDSVFLRLAREVLAGALYPAASRSLFGQYLGGLSGGAEPLWDTLGRYYPNMADDRSVLIFTYDDGQAQTPPAEFLVNPLRGLLSLLVVLACFSSCLYFYAEEDAETFARLHGFRARLFPLLCHVCAAIPVAAACLAALGAAGMLGSLPRELALSALLCLSSAGFCETLRRVCRSQSRLGLILPILMLGMLVLCPIFLHFKRMAPLRLLLPPVHYLNAAYRGTPGWSLPLYTAAALALGALLPAPSKR